MTVRAGALLGMAAGAVLFAAGGIFMAVLIHVEERPRAASVSTVSPCKQAEHKQGATP